VEEEVDFAGDRRRRLDEGRPHSCSPRAQTVTYGWRRAGRPAGANAEAAHSRRPGGEKLAERPKMKIGWEGGSGLLSPIAIGPDDRRPRPASPRPPPRFGMPSPYEEEEEEEEEEETTATTRKSFTRGLFCPLGGARALARPGVGLINHRLGHIEREDGFGREFRRAAAKGNLWEPIFRGGADGNEREERGL